MNLADIKLFPAVPELQRKGRYENMSKIATRAAEAKTGTEMMWLFLRRAVRHAGTEYAREEIRKRCAELAAEARARGCECFLPRSSYDPDGVRIYFNNERDLEYSRSITIRQEWKEQGASLFPHEAENAALSCLYDAGMRLMLWHLPRQRRH